MSFIVNPYLYKPTFTPCTVTDVDVINYLTAINVLNDPSDVYFAGTHYEVNGAQIWCAVNTLFDTLKNGGVYSHLHFLHLNLGETTSTQKFNAVNPVDSDGAYRLTYNGTHVYVDANGFHCIGIDDYINTHYRPLTDYNKFFIGGTQRSNKNGRSIGSYLGFGALSALDFKNRQAYDGWVFTGSFTTDKSQAYVCIDRIDNDNYKILIDEDVFPVVETVFGTPSGNYDFYYGAYNDSFGSGATNFAEVNFSTIFGGTTMSDAEHKILKDALYVFNQTLHRTDRNSYFFGDTITQGANCTIEPLNRWTKKVSDALYLNEINYGLSGRVLEDTTPNPYPPSMVTNSTTLIPTKTVDDNYIWIAYGVNDANYISDPITYPNYSVSLFTTQLNTIIDNILAKGWNASDIVLITGYKILASFNTQYQLIKAATISTGNSKGCQVIDLSGLSYTPPDNVHPDDSGHTEIANYVITQVI